MTRVAAVTTNPDYTLMAPALESVRDSTLGGFFVKRKGIRYLPHPSDVDQASDKAIARYIKYVANAEFDEVPQQTLKSWLGRMKFNDCEFELPTQVEYLIENADADGMPLNAMIEQTAANIMQVGWHLLVCDFKNAPKPGERLSAEQARQRKMRAAIKSYTRESVLDWSFRRIDGVLQLSYLKLLECRSELDPVSGTRKDVNEYLVYGLDEDGALYWQKFDNDTVTQSAAERTPITVGGLPLRWIPHELISDIKQPAGSFPRSLGLLAPICTAVIERYVTSAAYKESLNNILSTVYTSGWTTQAWEDYVQINGISYVPTGALALANLPQGVTMDVLEVARSFEAWERYFESNKQKIVALGGVWPNAEGAAVKTATQSENESSEITSRLVTLANNIESAFRRMVVYAGMFEGLWGQDDIERNLDRVNINLPKDFARSKLTPQEVKEIRDNYLAGIYGKVEAVRLLVRGGSTVSDVETILAESDEGA